MTMNPNPATTNPETRLAPNPIEPVVKTRELPLDTQAAFELFTSGMQRWWPLASHSIGGADAREVEVEGWVGGRIIETTADGTTWSWADVLAWDPPHRFVVAWHPQEDPAAASIVEVRFEPQGRGCLLRLEHRGWEEFGAEIGRAMRDAYDPGWDLVLEPLIEAAGSSALS